MDKYILDRQDAVLMIIDIQERLVPVMKYGEQVIKKSNILISMAKALDIPIIVTEQYPKGLGHTIGEIHKNLDSVSVFTKTSFSAYTMEVSAALKQISRKKIIITGMETHVCVFQTVRDLRISGYDVFVAADAVCSRTKENYLSGLSLMLGIGAVVTNVETVLFDLLKEAGTPEFKALSPLIK